MENSQTWYRALSTGLLESREGTFTEEEANLLRSEAWFPTETEALQWALERACDRYAGAERSVREAAAEIQRAELRLQELEGKVLADKKETFEEGLLEELRKRPHWGSADPNPDFNGHLDGPTIIPSCCREEDA
jgi:hypothetical protein